MLALLDLKTLPRVLKIRDQQTISRGTLRKIRIKQGQYRRCTHPEKNKLHEVLNCGEIIACFMQMILVVNCLLIFRNVFTNS